MGFPTQRPRRLRRTELVRSFVRETRLSPTDLIQPLFVVPGRRVRQEIPSMPGQFNLSVDEAVAEAQETRGAGVPAVILFGIPPAKDARGSGAYDPKGIVQEAASALKKEVRDLLVVTDVCLCEYTDHGHCGVVRGEEIVNDESLELLARTAVSHAKAGADIVAPSDMMDGRVGAIRKALDREGFEQVAIMAYCGDRRSYQMDPANADEALREVELDIREGADIVMVKPAMAYLDIVYRVKQKFGYPVAAYNVSGEYSLIKAAAQNGWIDERRIVMELLLSIRRAGADMILTYFAKDAARELRGQ